MDIEQVRSFCLSLPATTEDVKWGNDLCFSVGGKMFCVVSLELPFKCSFKVREEEFEELIVKENFLPAPYMAKAKWVLVTQPGSLPKQEWQAYLRQSYELVKAKLTQKVRRELGL